MLINGDPGQSIPAVDRGFLYGDGVFETILLINHRLSLWPLHQQRLRSSCKHLGIPLEVNTLQTRLSAFLSKSPAHGIIKIIVTRGDGGRGYQPAPGGDPRLVLQFHELPQGYKDKNETGVRVKICRQPLSVNSVLAGIKHLGRLDQVLASRELGDDFDEGIMLTDAGQVIEGTKSNLFAVLNSRLVTPSLTTAGVAGVMREFLKNSFNKATPVVQEPDLVVEDLLNASELFLCNSVFGVWPIVELVNAGQSKKLEIGPLTRRALEFQKAEFSNYG